LQVETAANHTTESQINMTYQLIPERVDHIQKKKVHIHTKHYTFIDSIKGNEQLFNTQQDDVTNYNATNNGN